MKVIDILFLEEAASDLDIGSQFYDYQEQGLGVYFFDSIISDIESLKLYAGIHSIYLGLYRMLSKRFPYAIYYSFDNSMITITAILDMRKNPANIRKQLKQRIITAPNK